MEQRDKATKQASNKRLILIVLVGLAVIGVVWFLAIRSKATKSTSDKQQSIFLACEKFDKKTAEKLLNTQLKEASSTLSSVNGGTTVTTGCSYVNADDKNKESALLVTAQFVRSNDESSAKTSFEAAKKQISQARDATPKPLASNQPSPTTTPSNPANDVSEVKDLGSQAIYTSRNGQLSVLKGRYVLRLSVKTAKGYDENKAKVIAKDLLNTLQ